MKEAAPTAAVAPATPAGPIAVNPRETALPMVAGVVGILGTLGTDVGAGTGAGADGGDKEIVETETGRLGGGRLGAETETGRVGTGADVEGGLSGAPELGGEASAGEDRSLDDGRPLILTGGGSAASGLPSNAGDITSLG